MGDRVEDRQVVAQRLSRSRGRHDADVVAGSDGGERVRLVRVERLDPALAQPGPDARIDSLRPGRVAWRLCLEHPMRRDQRLQCWIGEQVLDRHLGAGGTIRQHVALRSETEQTFDMLPEPAGRDFLTLWKTHP